VSLVGSYRLTALTTAAADTVALMHCNSTARGTHYHARHSPT